MPRRRLVYPMALAGFALLVAGCGGQQNPVRLDASSPSRFFDGFWDAITVPVVFVLDLVRDQDYRYYATAGSDVYALGYGLGIVTLAVVALRLLAALKP